MSHAKALGLEDTLLDKLAAAHVGYGRMLGLDDRVRPWTASSYLLAGVLRAVQSNPSAALDAFRLATEAYFAEGVSYWRVVAVCGVWNQDIPLTGNPSHAVMPNDLLHDLLAESWNVARNAGQSRPMLDWLSGAEGAPWHPALASRLRLPLGYFVTATREIVGLTPDGSVALPHLRAILMRAWEVIQHAQADRFHWKRLLPGLMPVEPEVIALCLVALKQWSTRGGNGEKLINGMELPEPLQLPLSIASELLHL